MLVDRNIRTVRGGTIRTPGKKSQAEKTQDYDNYYSRLIKLIPSEVIAFYLAMDAIASALPRKDIMLWVVFGISLIGAWFYLGRLANVTQILQRILTIGALAIWVYVFGGPFALLPWYDANYGKLVLVLFTFFVPVIYGKGDSNSPAASGNK